MMKSIGFMEFTSIARGVETADYLMKAAAVQLVFSKSVCPGKYIILISGDVDAVKSSIATGIKIGGGFVVDSLVISNVHDQVIYGLNAVTEPESIDAVGVVEYFNIAESIQAADRACKAAEVVLLEIRLGFAIGGKSFFVISGSVSSVESAVNAAIRNEGDGSMLVNYCVIPSPDPSLYSKLI